MLPVAVAPGDGCPAALGEDLHHQVLRIDKGFEVWKLVEYVIAIVGINDRLSAEEDLHPDYSKNEEDKDEEVEEFYNYWHYLQKSGKHTLDVVDDRVVEPFAVGRQ